MMVGVDMRMEPLVVTSTDAPALGFPDDRGTELSLA
jgi:hypothetical protein